MKRINYLGYFYFVGIIIIIIIKVQVYITITYLAAVLCCCPNFRSLGLIVSLIDLRCVLVGAGACDGYLVYHRWES